MDSIDEPAHRCRPIGASHPATQPPSHPATKPPSHPASKAARRCLCRSTVEQLANPTSTTRLPWASASIESSWHRLPLLMRPRKISANAREPILLLEELGESCAFALPQNTASNRTVPHHWRPMVRATACMLHGSRKGAAYMLHAYMLHVCCNILLDIRWLHVCRLHICCMNAACMDVW